MLTRKTKKVVKTNAKKLVKKPIKAAAKKIVKKPIKAAAKKIVKPTRKTIAAVKVVKKPAKKIVKKPAKAKITFPNFKEVQETFVVRQGYFLKEKGAVKQGGHYIEFPIEAKSQIVEMVKTAGFTNPVMVKLGHNKMSVFLPKLNLKKIASKNKVKTISGETKLVIKYQPLKENGKGPILSALKKCFRYSTITYMRNNGLVELKKLVEEEGKKAVVVRRNPVAKKSTKKAPAKKVAAKKPTKKAPSKKFVSNKRAK